MRLVSDFDDTGQLLDLFVQEQARATTRTMEEVRDGVVSDWRKLIQQAGLGVRLGNTIRGKAYPSRPSLDASAYIWTKAPKLIGVYAFGATIIPTGGRKFLWVPVNAPLRRGGKPMTPQQVEQHFGQRFIFVPRAGGRVLAFINVVPAKNRRGFRKATPRRLAQGRDIRPVLMFVLIPMVKVGKRFDLDALVAKWSDQVPKLLDQNWSR